MNSFLLYKDDYSVFASSPLVLILIMFALIKFFICFTINIGK